MRRNLDSLYDNESKYDHVREKYSYNEIKSGYEYNTSENDILSSPLLYEERIYQGIDHHSETLYSNEYPIPPLLWDDIKNKISR